MSKSDFARRRARGTTKFGYPVLLEAIMGVEQAASEPQGKQGQVTIMFTDLVGFTPLTERLDEEVVFALIKRLAGEQTGDTEAHERAGLTSSRLTQTLSSSLKQFACA
jgi:class 3 adenylate cyclase